MRQAVCSVITSLDKTQLWCLLPACLYGPSDLRIKVLVSSNDLRRTVGDRFWWRRTFRLPVGETSKPSDDCGPTDTIKTELAQVVTVVLSLCSIIVLSCFLFVWYATNKSDFFLGTYFLMIATFMFYSIQPYKDQLANIIACFFLFLLSLQYLTVQASMFMVFDQHKRTCLQF